MSAKIRDDTLALEVRLGIVAICVQLPVLQKLNHEIMNQFDKDGTQGGGQSSFQDGLQVDGASLTFLEHAAKWARFLAIMGFISVGLMVLGGIIAIISGLALQSHRSTRYGGYGYRAGAESSVWLMGFTYIIMAVVYFFPVKFLYDFAARALQAVQSRDSMALQSALESLKSHFKTLGIMTIIGIVLGLLIGFIFFAALIANRGRF
jgi:uncharacterized membrane protein